jgi:hypothetical protein
MKEKIGGALIARADFKNYLTDDFYRALRLYSDIKQYGLPQGRGWANEPASVMELVKLFDAEIAELKAKEKENDGD